jgi:hypothetical protein
MRCKYGGSARSLFGGRVRPVDADANTLGLITLANTSDAQYSSRHAARGPVAIVIAPHDGLQLKQFFAAGV